MSIFSLVNVNLSTGKTFQQGQIMGVCNHTCVWRCEYIVGQWEL